MEKCLQQVGRYSTFIGIHFQITEMYWLSEVVYPLFVQSQELLLASWDSTARLSVRSTVNKFLTVIRHQLLCVTDFAIPDIGYGAKNLALLQKSV